MENILQSSSCAPPLPLPPSCSSNPPPAMKLPLALALTEGPKVCTRVCGGPPASPAPASSEVWWVEVHVVVLVKVYFACQYTHIHRYKHKIHPSTYGCKHLVDKVHVVVMVKVCSA
jgi:hypothetical protein